jgi:hypothetical protein
MRSPVLVVCLVLTSASLACGPVVPGPVAPPAGPAEASERVAPEPPREAAPPRSAVAKGPIPGNGPIPSVLVEDVRGSNIDYAREVFAPTQKNIRKECLAGSTGAIRVRIKTDNDTTKMIIEPGSSLDGASRKCVLEALSTVDIVEILSRASPADRASGFSSVIKVEW